MTKQPIKDEKDEGIHIVTFTEIRRMGRNGLEKLIKEKGAIYIMTTSMLPLKVTISTIS